MEKSRVVYLDILRVLSIFAVMVLHVAALDWYDYPLRTMGWEALNFYHAVTRFCVPILFMVSGALFLSPNRQVSLRHLWSKNIFRIVTAFIFWSAVYLPVIFYKYRLGLLTPKDGDIVALLWDVFVDGRYHLWFLYAIIPLYVLTPFMRLFSEDKVLLKYFFALSFTFAVLLPTIQMPPFACAPLSQAIGRLNLGTVLFSQYAFYFMLGHCLNEGIFFDVFSRRVVALIYALGVLGTFVNIVGTEWLSFNLGTPSSLLLGYLTPFTACQSIALFLFVKRNFSGGGGKGIYLSF